VALAELLLDRPNVLLLDEPTNHLDVWSCEALETSLRNFAGTIVCVSHDRYFLDRAVARLLVLNPPAMIDFAGGYTKWVRKAAHQAAAIASERTKQPQRVVKPEPPKRKPAPADNPYKRPFGRLTLAELETQILQTESAIAQCQSRFGKSDQFKGPWRAQVLQQEYDTLTGKLSQLEQEYFAREK
jgi:ATP-binding cassette, subfamily F, member 3